MTKLYYMIIIIDNIPRINNSPTKRSLETERLLRKNDFKFVYLLLLVFDDILSQIQILSKYLQDVKVDMTNKVKQRRIKKYQKGWKNLYMKKTLWKKQVPIEENEFRSGIFYCILDKITNELDKRFDDNSDIISDISAFNPESITFLTYDTIFPFAKAHLGDIECLKLELKILHKSVNCYETKNNLKIKDVFQFHNFLKEYEIAF
ncbi:hypothetical protein QTP88_009345 [Uroleucon formosanum]